MKIVVIGGSGLIGKKLVPILRKRGHEAVSASPSSGVNALTGEGLAEALAGANVVVDVSNSPSWADAAVMEFFDTSTRNLLAAEAAAGVGHHVALSVVGADRMPDSGYMRAKVNQEKLIEAGGVPYTIVRATQFFEFLGGIADSGAEGDTVRLSTAPMQPLAADDVAAALADVAVGAPLNATVELAGPEAMSIAEFVGRFMAASGDKRTVIADPQARYTGAVMDEPRDRTGSESAPRPDAVRGLAQPLHTSGLAQGGSDREGRTDLSSQALQLGYLGDLARIGPCSDHWNDSQVSPLTLFRCVAISSVQIVQLTSRYRTVPWYVAQINRHTFGGIDLPTRISHAGG